MYALANSLLEKHGEYRVEVYAMDIFVKDVFVQIDLKIFGEKGNEIYSAEFEITRADGKRTYGVCMNEQSKEETFNLVEETVIKALDDDEERWE